MYHSLSIVNLENSNLPSKFTSEHPTAVIETTGSIFEKKCL